MNTLRVLLAQLRPLLASVDKNTKRVIEVLNNARREEVDIVIFPELYLHGYWSKDMFNKLAEPIDGPHLNKISKACEENFIATVVGFAELDKKFMHIYNSAALIDEKGNIKVYRKRHLPTFTVFDEARWFKSSSNPYELWEVKSIPIGVEICYDIFFPEIARAYTLLGAQLIIGISASPDSSLKYFKILTQARALENTVYFVWVNMVGFFDGLGFAGGSRAVSPLGDIIVECKEYEEDKKIADLDFSLIKYSRQVRPVLRDLRICDAIGLYNAYFKYFGIENFNTFKD